MTLKNIKIILVLILLLFIFSNVSSAEYYVNVSLNIDLLNKEILDNNSNVSPDDKLIIEILDEDGSKISEATVRFNEGGEIKTGETGKHIKLLKKTFDENGDIKYNDRVIRIDGTVNGTPTQNNITIIVKTDYEEIKFKDDKILTILKKNKYRNELNTEFGNYIKSYNVLNQKYLKSDTDYNAFIVSNEFVGAINQVSKSSDNIYDLLDENKVEDDARENQIENIKNELKSLDADMIKRLNVVVQKIKKEDVDTIQQNVTELKNDYKGAKSDLRSSIFYPAGLLIFVGIIGGILNVQRWKKNEIYLKMYSKKAKVANPVNISIIISVVLLIVMIVVLSVYGDLKLFAYLI